jgi:hypothetical protein
LSVYIIAGGILYMGKKNGEREREIERDSESEREKERERK